VEVDLAALEKALRRWPVPFASRDAAVAFFGGTSLSAEAWADGLEHRDGGWRPRFDVDVMVRTLREAAARSHWEDWERISCPSLVVRAGSGPIAPGDAQAMAARGQHARLVELAGAKHDLHLDRPAAWRRVLSDFVSSLGTAAA
jgi:pimeloyl-ACP methyl ester carboxylesterase